MDRPLTVLFPGTAQTTRTEVGGKAASLIRMTEAGLPVPSGAVLTTAFGRLEPSVSCHRSADAVQKLGVDDDQVLVLHGG